MIKMIAAVCRRPGMTHAECVAYVHQVHGAISREVPLTLRRYVQNHVFDAAFGSTSDPTHQQVVSRDSVGELFWDDLEEGMGATFAHPHVQQKVGPDGLNFSDVPVTSSLVAHEDARNNGAIMIFRTRYPGAPRRMHPWLLFALALACCSSIAHTTATGDALERAAVMVRAPERCVLLAAAMAGQRIVAVGERGIVALSDDGGKTWAQASSPTSVTLTAVRFADAKRGWAVGHGGTVLATDDGGRSWTRRLDGRRAAQLVLEAARASGDAKAVQEAERLVADGPDKPLLDLLLLDERRLLVVGAYGLALASEDAGQTWSSWMPRLPNPKGLHFNSARQRGQSLLLAGEQGLVLLSTDGGKTFRRLETPYKGTFFSAELLDERDIVLAGLRGNALRSTDGGLSWTPIVTPMPVSIVATALASDGSLIAGNQAGFVMALRGGHLVPVNAAPLPPISGLLPRPNAPLLVLSGRGVLLVASELGNAK